MAQKEGFPERKITLYHKTSRETLNLIKRSGGFRIVSNRPNSQGDGIYFTDTLPATNGKARCSTSNGVVYIMVTVKVGVSLVVTTVDRTRTAASVHQEGCDSVHVHGKQDPGRVLDPTKRYEYTYGEWVIYDITNIGKTLYVLDDDENLIETIKHTYSNSDKIVVTPKAATITPTPATTAATPFRYRRYNRAYANSPAVTLTTVPEKGKGILHFSDATYNGTWENYLCKGIGTINYSNGRLYVGEWKAQGRSPNDRSFPRNFPGVPHGHGTENHQFGYEGEWKDGMYHGYGKESFSRHMEWGDYIGEFKTNKRHGFGIQMLYTPFGGPYTTYGEWDNGILQVRFDSLDKYKRAGGIDGLQF